MDPDRTLSQLLRTTLSLLNYYNGSRQDCAAINELKTCMDRTILELEAREAHSLPLFTSREDRRRGILLRAIGTNQLDKKTVFLKKLGSLV